MMVPLRYMSCKGLSVLEQLHFEEILLRKSTHNVCLFNTGSKPTSIVVGYSGKVKELIKVHDVSSRQIPVIRRYTGGGTVVTDSDTIFVTLILNSNAIKTQPYPREIMDWTSKCIYEPLFEKAISDPDVKFALREHDYIINDNKIGGNAQSITRNRFVHHTSFLWDYKQENMNLLQMPKKRPEYRQNREHSAFLTKLKDHFTKEKFEELLLNQLTSQFEIDTMHIEDINIIINDLLAGMDKIDVIRTKLENICDYVIEDPVTNSLIKRGPSCVNL